ncbi:uncharacterized protein LOC143042260 [Mytilus galloprovincialis]|uniref:uncharacterized protein LOC143042260 n=1 Tax=Mytilus galloprovincialis TaxID=29158 RepID=UPI003F7CC50B
MSQYIFTNYSVTEDITTEDEGFNSKEEDSIYNSSPRTPRTEEDAETASIVSTDIVEESTTETVQLHSDTISNSSSDSIDSFSSIESQIEQFFQYQRENREKFGGILEQQISRLRREQFDPEFPERKCFTEDSTQTTCVENKSLSAICTYVKSLRELISEKIQADDITDLEENLQHWYRTLSEHAEDIGLTEEDKERLIHGKQDELSEIIQNIIDRYNVRVISSGENMWSADKLSPRSLTQAARKYDSSNIKESDRKSNTQKDNSQFSQYLKKYDTPETSKQGKYLSNDRDKKDPAQFTYDQPQIKTSKLSYPEAGRQNKCYNPIPSSSAYEQYDSKTPRQRKLSEYGEKPYSDPLDRISQKYDLIKSKPRDDLLTRQPQNQTSSKQLSNPEADWYNKRYNPIPSSSAYEQYDSKTSRQRKLSEHGENPYSDPLERISQQYDLIKSKPRDDLLTRQKEKSNYEPSERMFQKYTMEDRKPVDDLTSEKYSSTTKQSGIDRYKDSYKDMTSSIPGNNQFRPVINARAQPVDSFSRKDINRSPLFKDDKFATSREKPKQNIVNNEPTEDEIVQNILAAAYKKELKSTRLPQETNMNDQKSNTIQGQRKLSDNGEYTYSNPIDKVSKAYDLIKNKPRDAKIGYEPSDKMFQKSSTKDRKQLDYPTSQKNSSLTKPSKIDRHEDSYQMKSLTPAENQIRERSVINSREHPVDTFRQKDANRSPIFKEDKLTTLQEKPKQTIINRDLTEEEIVQNILDASLKKETKEDRLPQERKIKEPRSPRSDMLPKGQTRDMVLSNPPYNVFHGDPINKQTTDDRQNLKGNVYPGKTDDIYKRKDTTVQRQNPAFSSDSHKDQCKPAKTYATTKQTSYQTGVNNKPGPSRSSLDERNRSKDTSVTGEDRYKPIASRSTVEEAYNLADNIVTREEKYKPTASQRTTEKWLQTIERKRGPVKELTEEQGSQGAVNVPLKSDAAWDRLRQAQKSKEQRRDMIPKGQSRDIMLKSPQTNVLRGDPVHKQTTDDRQNQKMILYPDKPDDIYKQDDTKVQRQNPALRSDLYEDQYRPNNTSVATKQINDPAGMNYTPGASRGTLDEIYRRKDTSVKEEERYKPIASRSSGEEAYPLADNIVTRKENFKPTASQRTAEKWLQAIERKSGPTKELTEEECIQGTVSVPLKSEVKQDRLPKRQKDLEQESSVIPNENDSIRHTYPPYDVIHQKAVNTMASREKQKQTVDNSQGSVADGFQQTDGFVAYDHSIKPTENKRTDEKMYKQTDTPVNMKQNLNPVTNDDMYISIDRPVISKQERISNVGSSMSDKIHMPEEIRLKKEHIPKQSFANSQTVDQYKLVNSHITTDPNSVFVSKEKEQGQINLDRTETNYKLTDDPQTKEQKPEAIYSRFTNERRYKQTDKSAGIPILDGEKYRIVKEEQRYEPEASKSTLDELYTQNDNYVLEEPLNIPIINRRAEKERPKQVTDTPVTKDRRDKEINKAYINERKNQPTIRETTDAPTNIETISPKTVEEQYKPTESRRTGKEQNKPQENLINQSQRQQTFSEKYKPKEIPAFTEQRHKPTDNQNTFDNRYTSIEVPSVKDQRSTPEDSLSTDDERRKPASNFNTVKEQNKYKPTESTDRNKQVRKSVVPEDLRYHEIIKDERLESYLKSRDDTEKGIDRQKSIFDLPNPDDGVQVSLKPTKSWCPDGDGIFLPTTRDSEEDSDVDLSFSELEKTMYSRKASPRRKSIADELEQYFTDHPESPMLSTTLLSLPKTPGMQRPQYLNTLKEENTIEDLKEDNETDKKRISKDDLYFESTSYKGGGSIPSYTTADEYNKSSGSSSEYVVADDMLSMDTEFGGEFKDYQTDIYETGDRRKASFSNKPNTFVEATKFGKIARIPLDHSMPYNNVMCRSCGGEIRPYGTEQIIQINTNVHESHIETFQDSSGKVYYSTVKNNFHEGDKKPITQNVFVNLTGNQIDQSMEGNSRNRSYNYVQYNSVCLECQKANKPNGQINFKQQAVSKSTDPKRTQPDNIIQMNIPEERIQSVEIHQGNAEISYASPKKYTVLCSSSDSNLCVHQFRSTLLREDDLDTIPSNCIKVEVSVQHFRLWKCLLIASALFILFVSMIRRTNGNGDFRDFSLFDDLCTLIHLKNFEPPPCF